MRREDYSDPVPGRLIDIGGGNVAFVPDDLPPHLHWDAALVKALAEAERTLGEGTGTVRTLPKADLLGRLFLQKEAVLSSRIEDTRATLSDLLLFDLEPERDSNGNDAREVYDCVAALETGLERRALSPPIPASGIGRELHTILLRSARDHALAAGSYRSVQIHMGPTTRLEDAAFIPPPPAEIDRLMSSLDRFVQSSGDLPALIRLALIHYQFEIIHPFHPANGHAGRLLLALLLAAEQTPDLPLLYLSAFFERTRDRYESALLRVTTHGDWHAWLLYFLEAVRSQSLATIDTARRLLALRDTYHSRVQTARSSALVHQLVDSLFVYPAMSASRASKLLRITWHTAQQNIEKLIEAKILREVTRQKRNRIFLADEIVRSIEG